MDKATAEKQLKDIYAAHKTKGNADVLVDKFINDFFPKNPDKDPYWILGAQNLLEAILLSMLQDTKMTEKDFTIDKIKKISELGNIDTEESYKKLDTKQNRIKKYFLNQSLECRQLADSVISNPQNTFLNFITTLYIPLARL